MIMSDHSSSPAKVGPDVKAACNECICATNIVRQPALTCETMGIVAVDKYAWTELGACHGWSSNGVGQGGRS